MASSEQSRRSVVDGPTTDAIVELVSDPTLARLSDGRVLSYAEFGTSGGTPVISWAGGIGSRIFGLLFDEAARAADVRLVVVDRPGFGRSTPLPGRTILDWPADVAQLANVLDIDEFAVAGVSGGAPYAAACGVRLPDRVTRVGLMSPATPPNKSLARSLLARPLVLSVPVRILLWLARNRPERFKSMRAQGVRAETELYESEAGDVLVASTVEAGYQGSRGPATEIALVLSPWGFMPGEIQVPVSLWHGRGDAQIDREKATAFAAAIPVCEATYYDDVGHLSLPWRYGEDILRELTE